MKLKKFFKRIVVYYFIFLVPCLLAYGLWIWNGSNTSNSTYEIGFANMTMMKIFINHTIICLLIILSGKYFKIFSTVIFIYNALLFSYYVLISLELYGDYFVISQLIVYAPLEIFAIVSSKVLSEVVIDINRKTLLLSILVIEVVLLISAYLEMLVI